MKSVFSRIRQLKTFTSKEDGVAAVEFALLLPVLLILLIGMAETTEALNHDRKVSQVASTLADLVSQSQELTRLEVDDLMWSARTIMFPYAAGPMTNVVASVGFDARGKATVLWSVGNRQYRPWPTGTEPPISIPAVVKIPNSTVIVGMSTYNYVPMFASLAQGIFPRAKSMTFEDIYFLRPRLSDEVVCKTC